MKNITYIIALLCACIYLPSASAQQAKITSLQDVNLGTWNFLDVYVGVDYSFCTYITGDDEANYFFSEGGGSSISGVDPTKFAVTDGFGNEIILQTQIQSTAGFTDLLADGTRLGHDTPNTVEEDCAIGGLPTVMRTGATSTEMQGKIAGTYTGTVSILLEFD